MNPSPYVSVIVACRNLRGLIEAALASAQRQTMTDLEILVVDDGSTDGTTELLAAIASRDVRVRILQGEGRGPGAARNVGLAAARGEWIAVLDGDDLMHPRRLEFLLAMAVRTGSSVVADNLLAFHDDPTARRPYLLASGSAWSEERDVDLATYIRVNALYGKGPALGYLKPMWQASIFRRHGLVYNEGLRIGEDYDLIVRALVNGATMRFSPLPYYLYRRHAGSTSFRLRADDITALAEAGGEQHKFLSGEAARASGERLNSMEQALQFDSLVSALKSLDVVRAVQLTVSRPRLAMMVAEAARSGLARRLARRSRRSSAQKSHRRVVLAREGTVLERDGGQRIGVPVRSLDHPLLGLTAQDVLKLATRSDRVETVDLASPELAALEPFLLAGV